MSYQLSNSKENELCLLWRSHHSLIIIETPEERRAINTVLDAASDKSCYIWSRIQGLVSISGEDKSSDANKDTDSPVNALNILNSKPAPWIAIFVDLHDYLKEPEVCRALREAADRASRNGSAIMLISPIIKLPRELENLATSFPFPLPDTEHFGRLIRKIYTKISKTIPSIESNLTTNQFTRITEALIGLTEDEAEKMITQVILRDGRLDIHDVEELQESKRVAAAQRGLLEVIPVTETIDSIGGLNHLKAWLKKRQNALTIKARTFGIKSPKGILLLGVQGCGKSLCAKVVAGEWRRPLLRLDVGSLYNKFIGATESNLRESLRQAEASAPCILWIDEIEKAFASSTGGGSADGGVSQRLFATILGWMNDRTADVFIAATANNIENLPPELMRKGRFDEIFFVDLPPFDARKKIFSIHITKHNRYTDDFDLDILAQISEAFSGAEIEQAIISALYDAFEMDIELNTQCIINALQKTKPMAVVLAERIEQLRAWASQRCVMAH